MKLTITEISMHPEEESPVFSELATKIRLADDGAGMFVCITQDTDAGIATIRLDFKEVEELVKAITILNKEAEE
jgi:hypothetical protein